MLKNSVAPVSRLELGGTKSAQSYGKKLVTYIEFYEKQKSSHKPGLASVTPAEKKSCTSDEKKKFLFSFVDLRWSLAT